MGHTVGAGSVRKLFVGFGVFEIIAPQPIIDICERIGLENPEEAQLRRYALTGARIEGLILVWLLVRGRRKSPLTAAFLGTLGVVALIYPRPLIRLSQRFAYENPAELELRPWVAPAARALGALYLLVIALSDSEGDPDASPINADSDSN